MTVMLVYRIVTALVRAVEFLVIVRAIGSWIPSSGGTWGKIYGVVFAITEPLLSPVRRLLRKIPALGNVPIDFSPIALFLLLGILQGIVRNICWMIIFK